MSFNNISGIEHARNQEYVHRVNVEKGWFDKPVSFLECMALLMTEVVEVADAYDEGGLLGGWSAGAQMQSEFADCYIRLVDDASRFRADLGLVVDIYRHSYQAPEPRRSFDGSCMQLVRRVRDAVEAWRKEGPQENDGIGAETRKSLAYFYIQLQDMCDTHGVNLMKAFEAKMLKNELREHRHGGKFA